MSRRPRRPARRPQEGPEGLEYLLHHPADLGNLELRIWLLLRREPGLGICEIAARVGRHRKSVARAVRRLTEQPLLREVSPTPERRDPATGRILPSRYRALDPPRP